METVPMRAGTQLCDLKQARNRSRLHQPRQERSRSGCGARRYNRCSARTAVRLWQGLHQPRPASPSAGKLLPRCLSNHRAIQGWSTPASTDSQSPQPHAPAGNSQTPPGVTLCPLERGTAAQPPLRLQPLTLRVWPAL